jgi:DNA polymerase elongation subunit (family B)
MGIANGEIMSKIFIDIETVPEQPEDKAKAEIAKTIEAPKTMSKKETIDAWHNGKGKYEGIKDAAIEDAYRNTSFDGAKGEIISICVSDGKTFDTNFRSLDQDESYVIRNTFKAIAEMTEQKEHHSQPYFIGHFVAGFDLKFLFHRCVILGIKPPFKLPFDGRHNQDYYCTQQAWAGFNGRMSQTNICKALGIPGKPDDISGSNVWDFVKGGNVQRVAEYNRGDVEQNIEIYNRLNFK